MFKTMNVMSTQDFIKTFFFFVFLMFDLELI